MRNSIAEYSDKIKFQMSIVIAEKATLNKTFVRIYTVATFVCILVDAMCFCIAYRWFIESQHDHTNVWLMFATCGMLAYDSMHIFYLLTLKRSMPQHVNKWVWEAVFGDVDNLKIALKSFMEDVQDQENFDSEI